MTVTPTSPQQQPMTADEVFGIDDNGVVESMADLLLIARGHHTTDEEINHLLNETRSEATAYDRVIPGAHTTTWVLFTAHQDSCPASDPGCDYCTCYDDYSQGESWYVRAASPDTPGAIPVTWLHTYCPEMHRDFSQPDENERYLAGLGSWFENPVVGPRVA